MESEERRVLAAFADVHTPSAVDAQAALARVRARIDRGEIVEVEPEEARGRSRSWIPVVAVVIAVAAAVVLAWRIDLGSRVASEVDDAGDPEAAVAGADETSAGGTAIERKKRKAAAAASRSAPASESASASDSASASGSASGSASASESASGSASASESASASGSESASDSAKTKRRRPSVRSPDATLHAEMTLLRPAQQALRAGNHRRALQLFDDHARSFPDSSLAEERALGRIEALCGLGRGDEARKAAANFGRRFPGSPYRAKAERLCEEGEP